MLSAVPQAVLDDGFEPMELRGQTVYAKPGQWLLQLDGLAGNSDAQVAKANGQLGRINGAMKALKHLGRDGLFLLEAPKNFGHAKLMEVLNDLGNFGYVEPNGAIWSDALATTDPRAAELWGLDNTGQTGGTPDADIDAPEAWNINTGHGSVVGVIDTGVDYKHPDLVASMWVNPAERNGRKNFDDDGNGYKDDIHGYDFFNGDANPLDDNGHGTHVAGTIAAAGNNATGVIGVASNAKVMALKALGSNGSGDWAAAAQAINYATMMKTRYGLNINVTNNSYGGWSDSQALYDAVKRNGEAGMLFVASAGNDGSNIDQGAAYPAGFDFPNIISVAATDHNDELAPFSNYGTLNVDLAAPGVNILSTLPSSSYGTKNGTSMAAPHVAGVAALAWSYAPDASYLQVRNALLVGADEVESLNGKVFAGGRLNAAGTLAHVRDEYVAPTTPNTPTNLTATTWTPDGARVPSVELSWEHEAAPELQGYKIFVSVNGGAFYQYGTAPAGTTTFAHPADWNLTLEYRFVAANFMHESAPSESVQITTATAPDSTPDLDAPAAPTNLTARTIFGSFGLGTGVGLSWTRSDELADGYRIERSLDNVNWTVLGTTSSTSWSNYGLKRNTTYHYRVCAYNAVGESDYTSTSIHVTAAASGMSDMQPATSGTRLAAASRSLFSDAPIEEEQDDLLVPSR